jgi:hypothetical protein
MPETRIVLPEAEYYKFRALVRDVDGLLWEAERAAQQFKKRIAEAQARAREHFAALGQAHGFDPARKYGWNDETLEIFEVI